MNLDQTREPLMAEGERAASRLAWHRPQLRKQDVRDVTLAGGGTVADSTATGS
ncbi:MAG: hypothetical protein AB7K63_06070 [Vicinamibacterales bacterium]